MEKRLKIIAIAVATFGFTCFVLSASTNLFETTEKEMIFIYSLCFLLFVIMSPMYLYYTKTMYLIEPIIKWKLLTILGFLNLIFSCFNFTSLLYFIPKLFNHSMIFLWIQHNIHVINLCSFIFGIYAFLFFVLVCIIFDEKSQQYRWCKKLNQQTVPRFERNTYAQILAYEKEENIRLYHMAQNINERSYKDLYDRIKKYFKK